MPWRGKAGHHFVGMMTLREVFVTKTLILETSAGSDNRPFKKLICTQPHITITINGTVVVEQTGVPVTSTSSLWKPL